MNYRIFSIILGLTMILSGTGLAMFAHGSKELSDLSNNSILVFDIEDIEVFMDPNPLNFKSKGKFVTVHIEIPSEYDIDDISVSSIRMDDFLQPEEIKGTALKIGDHDDDDIPDIMLKFDRQAIIEHYGKCEDKVVSFTGMIGDKSFIGEIKLTIFDKNTKEDGSDLIYSTDFSSDPSGKRIIHPGITGTRPLKHTKQQCMTIQMNMQVRTYPTITDPSNSNMTSMLMISTGREISTWD